MYLNKHYRQVKRICCSITIFFFLSRYYCCCCIMLQMNRIFVIAAVIAKLRQFSACQNDKCIHRMLQWLYTHSAKKKWLKAVQINFISRMRIHFGLVRIFPFILCGNNVYSRFFFLCISAGLSFKIALYLPLSTSLSWQLFDFDLFSTWIHSSLLYALHCIATSQGTRWGNLLASRPAIQFNSAVNTIDKVTLILLFFFFSCCCCCYFLWSLSWWQF